MRCRSLASLVALCLLLTGCSFIAGQVGTPASRDDEATAFIEWVDGVDGVEAADLSYAGPTVQGADGISGSMTLGEDADVTVVLTEIREEYLAHLPDAEAMHLDVTSSLPGTLVFRLGAHGPDAARLDEVATATATLDASVDESIVLVSEDRLLISARSIEPNPAALLQLARDLAAMLGSVDIEELSLYVGSAELAAPQQGQELADGSIVSIATPLASDAVLMATDALVATESSAQFELFAGGACFGSVRIDPEVGETEPEVVERISPAVDDWFAAVTGACPDGSFEVLVGETSLPAP